MVRLRKINTKYTLNKAFSIADDNKNISCLWYISKIMT